MMIEFQALPEDRCVHPCYCVQTCKFCFPLRFLRCRSAFGETQMHSNWHNFVACITFFYPVCFRMVVQIGIDGLRRVPFASQHERDRDP